MTDPQAAPPTTTPVEAEVARIRALLEQRRYAEALAAANVLLGQAPANRDALYMAAVSYRYLNQLPAALDALTRLEQQYPRFSRLHQERGHCYVALRDAPRAIQAYLAGVNINPALHASWAKLERLYRMTGDQQNATLAADHVAALKNLPPQVLSATALFSDGELVPAEAIIRRYLLQHGDNVEAMRLLARIGIAREVLDDAEILLDAVLHIAPDYRAARLEYAQVLLDRHKHAQALEQLEKLLRLDPANRQLRTLYATACVGIGAHEKAIGLYRELINAAPRAADLHLSIAHSLKTLGRRAQSIDAYHAAAAARPDFGDAYWSLANLKTYAFTDDEIARMRAEEASPGIALIDRYHLCFALGKALEDRGEYAESHAYYERGNALKRNESRYRPELLERNTRLQIATCSREFFARRTGMGATAADPIFIVGLPRSGSTLIEQILASHSRVEGTHELADIQRLVQEFQGRDPDLANPRYPHILEELTPEKLRELGEKYLTDTRSYRTGKERFIDKMPNNFRHLGFIHLILPNAKIIDARREPMACCFSNLKQLFASGQEFTYSVGDIARYYRTYLKLMRHWDDVLPGKVLRVMHEDVVDNLEANVRKVLEFCGLKFEPACIEFYKTVRSVRTASSEQVRQPIFRDGLDQWKHYEPWLAPLKDALGDALLSYR
ncbi:MAG: sulfotransferase [Pseudomonadota bacterium]|nr:sulfotransferase [Pseudomonadota bacterium]